MKSRFIIPLFMLGCVLFNSCLKLSPKNMNNPELKCKAYYAVGKYLHDEENERFNESTDYTMALFVALDKYKCDVPEEERVAATEVIDWYYNQDCPGNYNIYYLIYRVIMNEKSYYVLMTLTEFKDEEESYEYRVEAVEKTLSDIQSYLVY